MPQPNFIYEVKAHGSVTLDFTESFAAAVELYKQNEKVNTLYQLDTSNGTKARIELVS